MYSGLVQVHFQPPGVINVFFQIHLIIARIHQPSKRTTTLCLGKYRGSYFHPGILLRGQNPQSQPSHHSWNMMRMKTNWLNILSPSYLTRMFLDLMSRWAIAGLPRLPEISVCRWLTPQAIEWVNLVGVMRMGRVVRRRIGSNRRRRTRRRRRGIGWLFGMFEDEGDKEVDDEEDFEDGKSQVITWGVGRMERTLWLY